MNGPPSFDRLVLPHLDAAYNLARWLLRSEQAAEDAVQEASLRAFRSLANLRGDDARPWLLGIVRNTCFTMLERLRDAPPVVDFDEAEFEAALVQGEGAASDPVDQLQRQRTRVLMDAASTDRHTVKPWFQGRLDYAPPVFDLAPEGFPLVGGRLEHVRGDVVAALAYRSDRHVIDLFVWPSEARAAPAISVRRGFNVLHWADGSMQYWAVSDLERARMERFGQLWRERAVAQ